MKRQDSTEPQTGSPTREELTQRCGHECLNRPDHDGPHFYGYRMGRYSYEGLLAEIDRLRTLLDGPCGSCHPCMNWSAERLRAAIERYLEAVTSNAPEEERTAAWDDLVLAVR